MAIPNGFERVNSFPSHPTVIMEPFSPTLEIPDFVPRGMMGAVSTPTHDASKTIHWTSPPPIIHPITGSPPDHHDGGRSRIPTHSAPNSLEAQHNLNGMGVIIPIENTMGNTVGSTMGNTIPNMPKGTPHHNGHNSSGSHNHSHHHHHSHDRSHDHSHSQHQSHHQYHIRLNGHHHHDHDHSHVSEEKAIEGVPVGDSRGDPRGVPVGSQQFDHQPPAYDEDEMDSNDDEMDCHSVMAEYDFSKMIRDRNHHDDHHEQQQRLPFLEEPSNNASTPPFTLHPEMATMAIMTGGHGPHHTAAVHTSRGPSYTSNISNSVLVNYDARSFKLKKDDHNGLPIGGQYIDKFMGHTMGHSIGSGMGCGHSTKRSRYSLHIYNL